MIFSKKKMARVRRACSMWWRRTHCMTEKSATVKVLASLWDSYLCRWGIVFHKLMVLCKILFWICCNLSKPIVLSVIVLNFYSFANIQWYLFCTWQSWDIIANSKTGFLVLGLSYIITIENVHNTPLNLKQKFVL